MFDGLDTTPQAFLVPPHDLVAWAARIRGHIEKMAAGSGGRYEPADILAALAGARMQLWIATAGADIECVAVTEIVHYPRARALRFCFVVGHNSRRWLQLEGEVSRLARDSLGCSLLEVYAPRRYGVLLRKPRWREFHVLSEKAL
jgi:hypothetical protein